MPKCSNHQKFQVSIGNQGVDFTRCNRNLEIFENISIEVKKRSILGIT